MSVLPQTIEMPEQLPFLEATAWQLANCQHLTPLEMLRHYERNWQYRGVLGDLSAVEGRVELDPPEMSASLPVACLSLVDRAAEKLLAKADRWLDTSTASRDLIDLAVLRFHSSIPEPALSKSEAAYPVIEPLKRAIINFQEKPEYRDRCYRILNLRRPNQLIDGLDQLAADFSLPSTSRTSQELAE